MTTKLSEDEKVYQHESFGLAGMHRMAGNVGRLFGSSLENHYSSIRIRVHEAECYHQYGRDRYFPRKEIIEFEFSAVQFAEFVTTSNSGVGIPCTIRRVMGKGRESPPSETSVEAAKVRESFREKMDALAKGMQKGRARAKELLAQKSLKVDERKELADLLDKMFMEVESNTPFMLDQFEEAADRIVGAAKAEVDAFVTQHVMSEGYKSLISKSQEEASATPALPPAPEAKK